MATNTFAGISAEQVKGRLASGEPVEFWNVLTDEYFKGQMIPGSRRVPLDAIGREVASKGISRDAEIIVYCAGPSCPQSSLAAEKLTKLGFKNVTAFEGGIEAWNEAGYPLETV